MAGLKSKSDAGTPRASLSIGLSDPGMTPLLRSGIGGLAASLRAALLEQTPRADWPQPVDIGGATYVVEPGRISVNWNGEPPESALQALFAHAFRLTSEGLIDLPGTYDFSAPPAPDLRALLQQALKKTFLQHGKSTKKAGATTVISFEIDEQSVPITIQPFEWFAHQDAWETVAKALLKPVELAGWANPGATHRHVAFPQTKYEYSAQTALAALFALVGSISLEASNGAGVLVLAEPANLVEFARVRARMSPMTLASTFIGGAGDAVLQIEAALRSAKIAAIRKQAVRSIQAMVLRSTPWASQQKSRIATLSPAQFDDAVLTQYFKLANSLQTRLRVIGAKDNAKVKKGSEGGRAYFASTSALRAFVADNVARGQPWFRDFATAKTSERQPRFIHYYWERGGLGALRFEEKKGLIAMTDRLGAAEELLVSSVQQALRQRFGRIWDETKGLSLHARRNRIANERERLRLAFAGSKTQDQIRSALADLWSRAGTVKQLQENWRAVLPLLGPAQWQMARDLSLVALASYQGKGAEEESDAPSTDSDNDTEEQAG